MASLQPCVISGGEGHKVARGCCTARASNDTPPRRAAVWRSGQLLRFISTRSLYTLLPLRGISPQGETRDCAANPCAPLEGGGEGHKVARGCCTARASNDTPPRRAAVWRSGQLLRFISTRSLYTLLPLRGISPQGETRDCAANPCAPLRGRRVGMGGKDFGL